MGNSRPDSGVAGELTSTPMDGVDGVEGAELPAQDVGIGGLVVTPAARPEMTGAPGWRTLTAVGVAIAALIGVYAFGRSAAPATVPLPLPAAAPVQVSPTAAPSPAPDPTATPTPPPELTDLLGQGEVLAEFDLGNRSRVVIWCRESVPGTQIAPTLALIHVVSTIRFGDQVVLFEELTTPWLPGGAGRRGPILATEGLGVASFVEPSEEEAAALDLPDGESCARCAPEQLTLGQGDVLLGQCLRGGPFGSGIVYVIAPAVWPGQTPLALHIGCGATSAHITGDQLVVESEAPLLRGLHEARFPLPSISFERRDGRFVASDLELLDWNCEVSRSSQLADRHLLRTDPSRSISYERIDSAIGEVGVHGPLVLGLTPEQCSRLTRAWWGQQDFDDPMATPISDLVGIDPPEGESDWFYSCNN